MAAKKNKLFNKTKSKNTKDSKITIEVNGVIIFALGVLLFLAIMTYHQTDATIGVITEDNNYEVNNFLGLIGATVARPVFTFTLPSVY
jgi:hypothetical protein